MRTVKKKKAQKARSKNCINRIKRRYYTSTTPGGRSSSMLKKIARGMAYFIAFDGHAMLKIEGHGLLYLLHLILGKDYVSPRATSIARILKNIASKARKVVGADLKEKTLFLTSDMATITTASKSVIVLSAHYIDEDTMKLKNVALAAKVVNDSHTAPHLAVHIKDILKDFDINSDYVAGGTTDGATNIINAMTEVVGHSGVHAHCFCHVINLFVRDVLDKFELKSLQTLKYLLTALKRSTSLMEGFRGSQYAAGATENDLRYGKSSCVTRWNSEMISVASYIDLREHFETVTSDPNYKGDVISAGEVEILKDIEILLTPFFYATVKLSGDKYVTASLVIPLIRYLNEKTLAAKPATATGVKIQEAMQLNLDARFGPAFTNENFRLATFLDPRFKSHLDFFVDTATASSVVELVQAKLNNISEPDLKDVCLTLGNLKYLVPQNDQHTDAGRSNYSRELKSYMEAPLSDVDVDPLDYWKMYEDIYPNLCELAIEKLAFQASSVASERIVSVLNLVVTKKRIRLGNKSINNLVFLRCMEEKHWLEVLKPKYWR